MRKPKVLYKRSASIGRDPKTGRFLQPVKTTPVVLEVPEDRIVRTPQDLADGLKDFYQGFDKEVFLIVGMNTRHRVKLAAVVSIGSLNASIVHPREVFHPLVSDPCASVILAHNHPSGDSAPSEDDLEITQRLVRCGEMFGIEVLDHVIVGETNFSFREAGLI